VAATSRYTVVVTLKHPDAGFPYELAATGSGLIFERKFQLAHRTTMGLPGTLIVGTGPFEFDSLDPTTGAELSANPHYWGGPVAIKHVSVRFFSDETSEALAFRAGDVDLAFPANPRAFVATSGAKILSVASPGQYWFSMDTKVAPWSDVHVRRAVAYAINRAGLLTAFGGYATPDYTMIPPLLLQELATPAQVDALIRSLPTYPFSLAKAKAELAKSAYPHGFNATLGTFDYGSFINVTQAIAAQLAKIGINIKVNVLAVGPYINLLLGPHATMAIQYNELGGSPDPGNIPETGLASKNAHTAGFNFADYTNPAADKLITQGASVTAPAKRFAAYAQLLKLVGNDVPYVPLYVANNNLALSTKFTYPTFNAYSASSATTLLGIRPR
jgi:peptide/nickel transport system substrate-binding protein